MTPLAPLAPDIDYQGVRGALLKQSTRTQLAPRAGITCNLTVFCITFITQHPSNNFRVFVTTTDCGINGLKGQRAVSPGHRPGTV